MTTNPSASTGMARVHAAAVDDTAGAGRSAPVTGDAMIRIPRIRSSLQAGCETVGLRKRARTWARGPTTDVRSRSFRHLGPRSFTSAAAGADGSTRGRHGRHDVRERPPRATDDCLARDRGGGRDAVAARGGNPCEHLPGGSRRHTVGGAEREEGSHYRSIRKGRITISVPSGRWSVQPTAPGYWAAKIEVTADAGQKKDAQARPRGGGP
jgi:hypothetical protein